MTLEEQLDQDMRDLYTTAGRETRYWGRRYLQAVRRHGGLARAKEMLKPRTATQPAGLDALIEAGRPELSLEQLVLRRKYKSLFTSAELSEARARLRGLKSASTEAKRTRERLFPDELEPGLTYPEGAKRSVRVNAYERNPRAQLACLAHHGDECVVCGMDFVSRYGRIGKGFIHVHHTRPVSTIGEEYKVDPVADLVPVCPNCHAMLHRTNPPRSVAALKRLLKNS
jgi:5-methylcytosine-specific restriction protein A